MNNIKARREHLNFTMEDVAKRMDVHVSTVSHWENGIREPKDKHRHRLAQVLSCTIYDLFPNMEIPVDEPDNSMSFLPSPFAKYSGMLRIGEAEIDCYVLDTGERVISLRSTVHAISGKEHGRLESYLGAKSLQNFIDYDKVASNTIEFHLPITGAQMVGRGITAETFIEICDAYVVAMEQNALTTDRQKEMAIQCSMILRACAKVGLIALIDESTGYQYERAEDALQLKLRAFIVEEMRAWEKTFPDDLWEELGRLTKWQQPLHLRPRWWGKLVMELVYDALDPDIASHLRANKPPPRHGQNYHQWLTQNVGLAALIPHIWQVIGISKTCNSLQELRDKVAIHYGKVPVQMTFYYPGDTKFKVR